MSVCRWVIGNELQSNIVNFDRRPIPVVKVYAFCTSDIGVARGRTLVSHALRERSKNFHFRVVFKVPALIGLEFFCTWIGGQKGRILDVVGDAVGIRIRLKVHLKVNNARRVGAVFGGIDEVCLCKVRFRSYQGKIAVGFTLRQERGHLSTFARLGIVTLEHRGQLSST